MDLFGKQHAGNLRGRTWKLEEFQEYFRQEQEKGGNSEKFQAVASALEEFSALQDSTITRENAVKMVGASERLRKACEDYSVSRRNAKSALGRERLAVVDSLSMFREDLNLDQVRDMRVVREYEGKTWRQAGRFPMAEVTLESENVQVVGDAMNQRMKVEYEGKKGFFTEQLNIRSQQSFTEELLEEIDPKEKEFKEVMKAYQKSFNDRLENIEVIAERPSVQMMCSVGEHWNQMGEKAPGRKELGKIFFTYVGLDKAGRIVDAYQKSLKSLGDNIREEEKSRLMETAIADTLGENDAKLKKVFSDNKSFFMGVRPPEPGLTDSTKQYRYFRLVAIQEKANKVGNEGLFNSGKKEIKALDKLIEDGSLIHQFLQAGKSAFASDIAAGYLSVKADEGYELTSRNIATSRIAELLGVGHIAAHSEKMKVRSGDKVLSGCFMEYAKGVDLRTAREKERRILDQVEIKKNPGLNRDVAIMEAFDYLCGQNDRHTGNMFYQLSEPDEQGKRMVIGLQGIDNDLAFGSSEKYRLKQQGLMHHMIFIDEGMAENIRALDRETLEYALGDLIPQNQINTMMTRVEKFKEHMEKNMVTIKPDGWELNEYAIGQKVADGDERGKRYINGLEGFERSAKEQEKKLQWNYEHKDDFIKDDFKGMQEERKKNPVALSFAELQSRERRDALKRNPKINIAQRRERQVNAGGAKPVNPTNEGEKTQAKQQGGRRM